jgi:hypothetical protein
MDVLQDEAIRKSLECWKENINGAAELNFISVRRMEWGAFRRIHSSHSRVGYWNDLNIMPSTFY